MLSSNTNWKQIIAKLLGVSIDSKKYQLRKYVNISLQYLVHVSDTQRLV